jgi:hypothetical protein
MTENRTKDPSVTEPPAFSYAEHFGNIRVLGELLRDASNRAWLTSVPRDPAAHQYVVWLGCNVIRTTHLAEALNDILSFLGTDFAVLGGPSSCCGIIHQSHGDLDIAKSMLRQTTSKFDAFRPEQLLYWCPSCDNQLRVSEQEHLSDAVRGRISVTNFLAQEVQRLGTAKLVASPPLRIALHWHPEFPEQERDGRDAMSILRSIPGVEVADTPAMAGFGRHCSDSTIRKVGKDQFDEAVRQWLLDARAQGATHIGSIYHSCHRQILLSQRLVPAEERMPVVNFLTLLARAFGLPERQDKFARFAENDDIEQLMLEVEPNVRSLGIKPDHARRALRAQFQKP